MEDYTKDLNPWYYDYRINKKPQHNHRGTCHMCGDHLNLFPTPSYAEALKQSREAFLEKINNPSWGFAC